MSNVKTIVLGGSGLLGGHLLWELTQRGEQVVASYRSEDHKNAVLSLFRHCNQGTADQCFNQISWIELDILDVEELRTAMAGFNKVYHCAALVSFHRIDLHKCLSINRQGTANVVNVCLEQGHTRLMYVSSTAALGVNKKGLTDSTFLWKSDGETSGYSVSKYGAEKEVWRGIEEGLDAVIINPCVIFGPGNWNEGPLTIFSTVNKGLSFYPKGKNAIVDARDVAKSMVFLMESEIHSQRFLCTGDNVSFRHLLSEIAKKLGKKAPKWSSPRGIAVFLAYFIETFHLLIKKRKGLTIESAQASYKHIEYDSTPLKSVVDFEFYGLDQTLDHAIKGRIHG